jgi:hypothetical protein
MYKKKYLKYKTKYLDLQNQLGGGSTAAELKLEAEQKKEVAEKLQQSSQLAQQTLKAAQAKAAQTQAKVAQTQAEAAQKEANKAILIAEGELSNMRLSIQEIENRLLEAQEKKENMLQIVDDARKQLIKVAQEQKVWLSPDITIELTSLLGKEYKDKSSVLLSLEAIKQQEPKVETTPEAQIQPTTLQEALVKLYRVLKEILLDLEIEKFERERLRFLKDVIEFKQQKLVELIKKKAQVIKEKVIVQQLENGDLLLNDYLQIGSDDSDDTKQLTNIIINPTEQFYTQNKFTTGNMLANIKKNVFIVLNKLFIDTDMNEIENIKLPVGILINFIENQIYVIIYKTQYSYNYFNNLMKADSYSVENLLDFDKYYIKSNVSIPLYYRLMDNLNNCLKESKHVINLLTNNNLLSMIETQLRILNPKFY